MEKVRPWCGQPSDRGRLKNRNRIDVDVDVDICFVYVRCYPTDGAEFCVFDLSVRLCRRAYAFVRACSHGGIPDRLAIVF